MNPLIKNCINCDRLGSDGDGPEYNGSFPVCHLTYCNEEITNEDDDNTNKPGFPFETEQTCHIPGFWQYLDLDPELKEIFDKEAEETAESKEGWSIDKTYKKFVEKYK